MTATGVDDAAPAVAVPLSGAAPLASLQQSETATAVGLAAATMVVNLVAIAFTVIFTRVLGAGGYGSLAALMNLTLILAVPGSALQVAAAREGMLGRLGRGGELAATLDRWTRRLLVALAGVAVISVLARAPLAALLDIDEQWAAAAVPPTAVLWLMLCLQRGLLQSTRAYKAVGVSMVLEAVGRLAMALGLVALGLGVTGAYVGTAASFVIAALVLGVILRRRLGLPDPATPRHPLRTLARGAAVPVAALTLVAALQNVDVIMAKHALLEDEAGVYAAATVAGKAIVWIAVGLGLYVVPETTRRAAAGQDPRIVLLRSLAVVGALSACALAIFAAVPELLLRTAFGAEFESGAPILLTLGAAFAFLAVTYLASQFQLGLHHRAFLIVLAIAAVAEPILLLGADDPEGFATRVLSVQAVAAVALVVLSARRSERSAPFTAAAS